MKGYIYKITNKVNDKIYIGQTRYTVEFRWRLHIHKLDNTYFHNAIRKYGIENFTIETIEECPVEQLNSREIFYIAKYNSFKNGYNLTIGGNGNRRLLLDDKYDEIKELYLSGFSSNKIAELYEVDKASIVKILKLLDVKIRNNKLSINNQELQELIRDYQSGYSLRSLAKRYDCSPTGLKLYLIKKGVDIKVKYSILKDTENHQNFINDYLDGELKLSEILKKYHCDYKVFKQILSLYGIDLKGQKHHFKLREYECLECIELFKKGTSVLKLAYKYKVNKSTIYSMFRRYHIDYKTI